MWVHLKGFLSICCPTNLLPNRFSFCNKFLFFLRKFSYWKFICLWKAFDRWRCITISSSVERSLWNFLSFLCLGALFVYGGKEIWWLVIDKVHVVAVSEVKINRNYSTFFASLNWVLNLEIKSSRSLSQMTVILVPFIYIRDFLIWRRIQGFSLSLR